MDRDFKTDANGRQCLKAGYVMKRDPRAKAAYDALRRRGLPREEAEARIEQAFQMAFTEALIAEAFEEGERGQIARDRRKTEIWLSLQEGLSVERIFPDLPLLPARPS
jgi:hypothetical protein